MGTDDGSKWQIAVVALLIGAGIGLLRNQSNPTPPDDRWFQANVIDRSVPVVVKFGAEWCGPCRSMHQELEKLRSRVSGFHLVEINVDEKPELARHYGVSSIPRTFLFVDGQLVSDLRGSRRADDLESWLADNAGIHR
ncbi:MAG: thioredoxin family protein [Planctomycetaceae bacterium]|nr:thioredoxin family protein [Planctomycetaceae bacterium]